MQAVLWSALQGWGGQLIGFSVYILLARLLGPQEFGLIAMAFVFIAFTQVFVEQGLSAAIIQKKNLNDDDICTAFWSNVAAGLLLTFLAMASAGLVAGFYKEPSLESVVQCLAILLFLNSIGSVQECAIEKRTNVQGDSSQDSRWSCRGVQLSAFRWLSLDTASTVLSDSSCPVLSFSCY